MTAVFEPPPPFPPTLVSSISSDVSIDDCGDEIAGDDTAVDSLRPWSLSAVSSLVLSAAPLPRADANTLALAASEVRILVSTAMLAPRRRSSEIDKMSTLDAMVLAALATACLYFVCVASSKSSLP